MNSQDPLREQALKLAANCKDLLRRIFASMTPEEQVEHLNEHPEQRDFLTGEQND